MHQKKNTPNYTLEMRTVYDEEPQCNDKKVDPLETKGDDAKSVPRRKRELA